MLHGVGGDSGEPADRHFGEQGARLSYGSYLQLSSLLAAQKPESDPPVHDELLFIVTHQVYELWFRQLLHELTAVRVAMFAGDMRTPRLLLARTLTIQRVLVEQIAVLETMTPQDFLSFRSHLAPASGFQSVQFRELEFLCGAKDAGYFERLRQADADEQDRLLRRFREPSLWDAYCALLTRHGLAVGTPEELATSLDAIATDRASYGELWDVAEALVSLDEWAALWRARHVMMVERQIGTKSGTGGSAGAPYLRSRLDVRYFPALWELRARL